MKKKSKRILALEDQVAQLSRRLATVEGRCTGPLPVTGFSSGWRIQPSKPIAVEIVITDQNGNRLNANDSGARLGTPFINTAHNRT